MSIKAVYSLFSSTFCALFNRVVVASQGLARLPRAILLLMLALLGSCAEPSGELSLSDAWYRLPPPGLDKSSAYLQIHNRSAELWQLGAVRSTDVRAVEIHEIIRAGEQLQMRRRETIAIAPGQTLQLQPGGLHLMLFGLQPEAAANRSDTIDLALEFYDAAEPTRMQVLQIEARPVDPRG